MKINRRVFLGVAAGGGLVALAGGYSAVGPMPVAEGLRAFSKDEMATLKAAAEALFPKQIFGLGAAEVDVAGRLDAHVATFFPRERGLLRLFLRLMELRSRVDGGGRFSSLLPAQRAGLMASWEAHADLWALGVKAVRALCALAFFADARVQATLGWGLGCDLGGAAAPLGGAP